MPPTESPPVSLFDIELRSGGRAEPAQLITKLVELKVFTSTEAARSALAKAPTTLARYVGQETAYAVVAELREAGAEVALQGSHVTCPHCGVSVPCEGEASESGRGIVFTCVACRGLTFLDTLDRKFHPMLRCSGCKSLLNLPAQARHGNYRCKCGQVLSYAQFQGVPEVVPQKRPSLVTPRIAILSVALLLAVGVATSLIPLPGLSPGSGAVQPVARTAPKVRRTSVYRQFNATTDRPAVIAALGPPERESLTEDKAQQVLFYRSLDLYVILESGRTGYTYLSTVRLSDEVILHERPVS